MSALNGKSFFLHFGNIYRFLLLAYRRRGPYRTAEKYRHTVRDAAADAAAALEQLGFRKDAVNKTVNALLAELPEAERTTENLIRAALLKLNF